MSLHKGFSQGYSLVVVSNRLPVDYVSGEGDESVWRTSPGGLVTALEPVVREAKGVWVGWPGAASTNVDPFNHEGIRIVPVSLSTQEFEEYYEGFSNSTLWPLYHDVIEPPVYHREWWETYVRVNRRFAEAAAALAARAGIVWVHDYQLQLVPQFVRELRPDLTIGFFNHIPFPPTEIFQQLPWRQRVLGGLLGADVVGFQRATDANNFIRSTRRLLGYPSRRQTISLQSETGASREITATHFPISIDTNQFETLAQSDAVQARADEIRRELGNPETLLLGIDRLDYTKGIQHRLKAYGELLDEGRLSVDGTALIQVASPSREDVDAYRELRDDIELTVGRINGEHSSTQRNPIVYLHQSYPREEMAALYLAADIMLVTSLRDGMNLVAKEFVACNLGNNGVLVLSEFAGAADELKQALLVNPHDIEGLKDTIERAVHMPQTERVRRMRALRRRVKGNDVAKWSADFLDTLTGDYILPAGVSDSLVSALREIAATPSLLIALDFDGTVAPHVDSPDEARALAAIEPLLNELKQLSDTHIAYVSGRSIESLKQVAEPSNEFLLIGSHGVEVQMGEHEASPGLTALDKAQLSELKRILDAVAASADGAWVEEKAYGFALHTRQLAADRGAELRASARTEVGAALAQLTVREGVNVIEFAVRATTKGDSLRVLRERLGQVAVLYAGDDVTDEDAFAVLTEGDLGIKVGRGDTLADHRVRGPDEIAQVLQTLLAARSGLK